MSVVERPDGVEIEWRERGEGPLVALASVLQAPPDTLSGLGDELSSDHRFVDYDLRGTGASTRAGPYDMATDVADLIAVLEAAGGSAVVIALGDGANRAVHAAAARGDLVSAVVVSGQALVGPAEDAPDALSLSGQVLEGLLRMYETDHRAAIRSVVTTADENLSETEIRERVELTAAYVSRESLAPRTRSWVEDDAREDARALGERLCILAYPGNPWFPIELLDVLREQLPEARIEEVAAGAMSRPDLAAAAVRRITGA